MGAQKLDLKFKDEIISQYLSGKSTVELGKVFEVSPGAIYSFLRKNNVKIRGRSEGQRKYDLNELYFDDINSQEKAYFLGILYADGCNSTELNLIRLVLSAQDIDLLKRLTKLIYKEDRPLAFRKGKEFIDKQSGKIYQRKDSYCLSIQHKHTSMKLNEYGLVKAKSLKLKFPDCVSRNLIQHFIRGYFDGDGTVGITIEKQLNVSILGTEQFCSTLKCIIKKHLGINSSICHTKKGSKIKQLVIHGNLVGRKFMDWIYNDSQIHLDRKYTKYQDILNIIPPMKPTKCKVCSEKHYSCGYCKKHKYEFIDKKLRHERYLREKNSG